MNKKISVLVPTIGSRRVELIRLFESLIAQQYSNMEVIVIVQDNYDSIKELCELYFDKINTIFVPTEKKGLSRARNIGLRRATGDIILLSDDDCWYEKNAFKTIEKQFEKNADLDVLLTQIYDPISNMPYKNYPERSAHITKAINLLSKSSIEIAFKLSEPLFEFDENFGLGSKYIAGEENDFLIRLLENKKNIRYVPTVTVFHEKKVSKENKQQLIAKGAFYCKNFGFIVSNVVLIRDLLIKHQNNFRWFWNGYFDYKKQS